MAVAVACLFAAACGGSPAASRSSAEPERPHLVVGTLPIPDGAPLFIAINRGFFKEQGLQVEARIINSGPEAIPLLRSGVIQAQLNNYVSAFAAAEKGVVKFTYVADSYQSGTDTFDVVVPHGSNIASAKDLAGKKIAVPSLNSISTLTITASLAPFGVKASRLTFVQMPLPTMKAALLGGQVDAAWVTEPFLTDVRSVIGAVKVLDTMQGPTQNFPIAGWGMTEKFATSHPRTVAAFQRAMGRAQTLAATDRSAVTSVIPTYTKIPPGVAQQISLGEFPTTLDPIRLQRVADLMLLHGMLTDKLDVKPMILARP